MIWSFLVCRNRMSFKPLTEAECGQANPLVRLTSHVTHDHTFSESHGQLFPSSSDQLVEQFLQETRAIPQTFRMDDLMREMHEIESQRSILPPVPASRVKDQLNDDAWAQQYIEDGKVFTDRSQQDAIWAEINSSEGPLAEINSSEGPMISNSNEAAWANDFFQETNETDPEFRRNAAEIAMMANEDEKFAYSRFMQFMKQAGDGDVNLKEDTLGEDSSQAWAEEFMGGTSKENSDTSAEKSVEQPTATTSTGDGYNDQFWSKLQEEWKKLAENESSEDISWAKEYTEYYDTFKDYTFSEDNPMFDVNDPLERGKELLKQGDLPSAVLCFEAAVKKEPDNAEAWQLLGVTQAENEQDPNAISALKRCLELQPENLTVLMALAVSYTNENYYNQACQSLMNWLRFNPKYADLVPPDFKLTGQVTSLLDPGQHHVIQDLFIKAAQRNPKDIDYEVQCGLGVLFNLTSEHNKAIDCFKAALSVKPDDARLWNRLGATLANGNRPEEAVDAYHHALELAPGFIRARYNIGITCINLGAHREAAEHFLTALNQQARGKDITNSGTTSQMSNTIWATLRMCVALMNKPELRAAVDNRDLETLNREFNMNI